MSSPTFSIEETLCAYFNLSKSLVLRPLRHSASVLPLGAAFLAGMHSGEAAIVYSGTQNISCNLAGSSNRCYVNIDGAGGNDLEFHREHVGAKELMQVDEVPGGGWEINGFHALASTLFAYPYANAANVPIGAGAQWGFAPGAGNTLSEVNDAYANLQWSDLANGTTRFVGIRGTVAGATRYGWLRITKNGFGNLTIVDWAYENTGASILTGQTVALPVELLTFDYQQGEHAIALSWQTGSEQNNAGFDIERSDDGASFHSIGWVDGVGNSTEMQEYTFTDTKAAAGLLYYYRLRQVDVNGQFSFSQIIEASIDGLGATVGELYPNPTRAGKVSLDFNTEEAYQGVITVYDAYGQQLQVPNLPAIDVPRGHNVLEFDFSSLASGVYFVRISGRGRFYRKLVIE